MARFIPSDWALIPDINGDDEPDIAIGDSFRLLFVTSTGTYQATSSDIGVYNSFVQMEANVLTGTGAPIAAFKDEFRALISTADVDARDNSATNRVTASPADQDAPIYWLNGDKIADGYAGFYDELWNSTVPMNQDGNTFDDTFFGIWIGSADDGTKFIDPITSDSRAAGMTNVIYSGYASSSPRFSANKFGSRRRDSEAATNSHHLYALSPILTVASADATLSALTLADSASTNIPLAGTFAKTTTAYSASVANSVTSITVTPTTEHSGTVAIAGTNADGTALSVDGTGTGVSGLTVGTNIITLTVTAEDTIATTLYTIAVTRAAAPLSFDGTIADQIWTVDAATTLALPTASGGGGAPIYSLSGALPAGLSFNATATPPTISGQPSDPTSATALIYTATDSHPTVPVSPISQTFLVTVNPVPTVTLVVAPASIGESGGGNVSTVTATLDYTSGVVTTLTLLATPGTGTVAGDYTLSSNTTLTIAAGETSSSGTVTLTAEDNQVDAPTKEVTVSATAVNTNGVTAPAEVSVMITDDEDTPTVSLVLSSDSISESGTGNASTVTATLDRASGVDTTLTLSVAPGAVAVAGDYALSGTTLRIAAGATTSTDAVTLTAVDNAVDAPNKVVTLSATADNSHAIMAPAAVTVTITDDDDTPTVTLVLTPDSISESGTGNASTVTATLDRASGVATTLTLSAAPGAATLTGDYVLSGTTLRIAAGATTSTGVVTLTAVDNAVDAPDKMVTLSATANNSHGITAPAAVTVRIMDDDSAPTVSLVLTPDSISENGVGNTSTVTATLDRASGVDTTLMVSAMAGADTEDDDYALSGTMLRIVAGATDSTGVVTLTAVDNAVDAPNKMVTLSATADNSHGIMDPAEVTVTIIDDEAAPVVTLVLTPVRINENGGFSTVTAALSHPSTVVTTLVVTAAPGSDAVAGDYTLSGTALSIAPGATASSGLVTVTAVDNSNDDPPQSKQVILSASATNSHGITQPANVTLTISDAPIVRLLLTSASISESGTGNISTVTASLSRASTEATTLSITATPGGDTLAGEYTLSGTTLSIEAGATTSTGVVTLTAVDNAVDAPDKTVTLSARVDNSGTEGLLDPAAVTRDD